MEMSETYARWEKKHGFVQDQPFYQQLCERSLEELKQMRCEIAPIVVANKLSKTFTGHNYAYRLIVHAIAAMRPSDENM